MTTMREYLALPAVSASVLRTLLATCPLAAWAESWLNPWQVMINTPATDAGTIAHAIVLEGRADAVAVIDPKDYPAKTTGAIPEGWTNQAIRAARDAAREAGKIPVLLPEMARIDAMVAATKVYIESLQEHEPAVWRAFQDGRSEESMTWDEGDVPCKIRPDRIAHTNAVIVDLKFTTTSAQPEAYAQSQIFRQNAHVGAALYRRGVKATTGVLPDYYYLVTESDPPYLSSLIGLDPRAYAIGDQMLARALAEWQQCARAGIWPAYPARAVYPELPAWMEAHWVEDQIEAGIPYDPAKLFARTA